MVEADYMNTSTPPEPSPAHVFFNQRILPMFIDGAGAVESVLMHASRMVVRAPVASVCGAALVGVFFGLSAKKKKQKDFYSSRSSGLIC